VTTTLTGIDTSHWQGTVDWSGAFRATGFDIAKATQGVVQVDSNLAPAAAAARAAGKPFGTYHYPNAGDPIAEAAYYAAHNGRREGEIQVLDFEGAVMRLADPVGWAVEFIGHVHTLTGNLPLIYLNSFDLHHHDWSRLVQMNVGLWVANWSAIKPDPGQWPFLILWQHSDSERIAGIPANVDGDVFFGDQAVWAKYGHSTAPAGTPAPVPVPPAPRPPAPVPVGVHPSGGYRVNPGDTLTYLAGRFHTTVHAIVAANSGKYPSLLTNPDLIREGWVLRIPIITPAPAPAPAHPRTYTIRASDSDGLAAVASRHGTTLAALLDVNPQLRANPGHIEPGWVIHLP
jgi:GH25 family lysozyme M1 (1,4-beta-N-acetylmuramidase)/LysM repeat protein